MGGFVFRGFGGDAPSRLASAALGERFGLIAPLSAVSELASAALGERFGFTAPSAFDAPSAFASDELEAACEVGDADFAPETPGLRVGKRFPPAF